MTEPTGKPALPEGFDESRSAFQRDANGLLRREAFTPERIAYLTEQVAKSGLWTFISAEDREASRQAILAEHTPGEDRLPGSLAVFGADEGPKARFRHLLGEIGDAFGREGLAAQKSVLVALKGGTGFVEAFGVSGLGRRFSHVPQSGAPIRAGARVGSQG